MAKKISASLSGKPFSWMKITPVLLALGAFLLFANTIGNGYNMDDELVTFGHRYTSKGLSSLSDILTNPYYSDAMGYKYGYRPLVHVSFAIEHQFLGENPHVSHFINVLLYALCVYLFFGLLKIWMGKDRQIMAIVATVLFALHPVHTEVVASIKNRDEILALLFGLLAGISFFKNKGKPQIIDLLLSAVYLSLALLAKKSMYPLVMIFPLVSMILYSPPIKNILFYAAFLVLPGGILVSEFDFFRMLGLVLFPVMILVAVHCLIYAIELGWGEVKRRYVLKILDYRIGILLVSIMVGWGIWSDNLYVIAIAFIFLLYITWVIPDIGVSILIFLQAILGYFISEDVGLVSVLLSFWYLFEDRLSRKTLWSRISLVLIVCVLYSKTGDYAGMAVNFILIGILAWRRVLGQFLLLLLSCIIILWGVAKGGDYDILYISLFFLLGVMSILRSKYIVIPWYLMVHLASILSFGLYFYEKNIYVERGEDEVKEIVMSENSVISRSSNMIPKLQEGRQLEFAENTLTVPHTLGETIGTGAITLGEYLRLMVFPWELSFYYGYAKIDTVSLANPWVWLSLLAHLGLLVLAFWQIKKRPFVTIGILWYLLSIGLFSNWVELVAGMVGERLAFTASAGFCILVAALIVWIKPSLDLKKPGWVEVGLLLICVVFSFRTVVRNADWKDRLTLMGRDIQHLDNSAQANNLYALNLMGAVFGREGNYTEEQKRNMMLLAQKHFDRAIQIWPDFFNAAYDKGRVALTLGDKQTAMAAFEHAVSIKRKEVFSDPYYQLDKLYFEFRMYDKLLKNAKAITRIEDNPEVYNRLAKGYYYVGKPDSSIYYLDMGLQRYPNDNSILQNKSEIMRHVPLVQ